VDFKTQRPCGEKVSLMTINRIFAVRFFPRSSHVDYKCKDPLAQLGERGAINSKVIGSSPVGTEAFVAQSKSA